MFRVSIALLLFTLTACGQNSRRPPKTSVYEVTGNRIERVAGVMDILNKSKQPPTTILDARFIEEKIGDGVLGPSDFQAFYFIEVTPKDIEQWTDILTPVTETVRYAQPRRTYDWWISRSDFDSLKFYKPDILTSRLNGWVGVDQQIGRIYIFTFTT